MNDTPTRAQPAAVTDRDGGLVTVIHPVAWGAILVGALVAIMIGIMLSAVGVGTGASTVDAVARDTPDATTFARSAAIWFAVANGLGILAGGWVAARLAAIANHTHAMLHGAGVWAAAWAVAVMLAGTAASGGMVAVLRGAGATLSGAASAVASVAPSPEALVDRVRSTLTASATPGTATREELSAEAGRLVLARVREPWTPAERERLATIVAQLGGIPQQEAAARIDTAEQDLLRLTREAEEAARRAADAAAKATVAAALFGAGVMLVSLLAGLLGAWLGARRPRAALRDGSAY